MLYSAYIGGANMPMQISLVDNKDKELIEQIKAFQKAQELPSCVAAVRVLCKNGLRMCDVVKTIK